MEASIRTFSDNAELVARRRRHIALCAARLFVKKGYEKASVREIADACAMSKGTLYHYVGTKEDILYLVIHHGLAPLHEWAEKIPAYIEQVGPAGALRQVIREMLVLMDEYQDITMFTYQDLKNLPRQMRREVLRMEEETIAALESLLRKGCETGEFVVDDVTLVAHDLLVGIEMWAVRRWFLGKRYTLDAYIRKRTDTLLDAISGERRRPENPKGETW
jgi:AcrR family transcriptional regulator